MTSHEQKCFNDALHKAKVLEWQRRICEKLTYRLIQTEISGQVPLLRRVEKAIDGHG